MKNMKKIVVVLVVCLLVMTVMTGCSNKPSDETNAASLNELKAAVEEVGKIIANDLPKMTDEEGKGVVEQIDILQETLNGFYVLFE